ncbi:MAG: hypothetical protein L3J59_07375 [Methylococcaceae bacterium]|nr:hypothetical protein [Methylococcaceae bacterium]
MIKQRLCGSEIRWKSKEAKAILSLTNTCSIKRPVAAILFWGNIEQYGTQPCL